jgi:mycoredoxin
VVVSTVVYGTKQCSDCSVARKTLDAIGVTYDWIDLAEHPEAVPLVLALNNGNHVVPTIVLSDGSVLAEPDPEELIEAVRRAGSKTASDQS